MLAKALRNLRWRLAGLGSRLPRTQMTTAVSQGFEHNFSALRTEADAGPKAPASQLRPRLDAFKGPTITATTLARHGSVVCRQFASPKRQEGP